MKIEVIRIYKKEEYTIGKLYIDGKYFCDTIEDKDRGLSDSMTLAEIAKKKVYGQTAIPTGEYKVYLTLSPKFKRLLPDIAGVKGFAGVRIHAGNTASDSLGCILVGENKSKGKVINSRNWENALVLRMKKAQMNGESITLTIK